MNLYFQDFILISIVDKLREHILRIHAKSNTPKNSKNCKSNIKDESVEPLYEQTLGDEKHRDEALCDEELRIETLNYRAPRNEPSTESCGNDKGLISTDEKDPADHWDPKSMQSGDELLDGDPTGTSSKPRFKPKVSPTDYERFIYKCQYCMLGFKRRGKRKNQKIKYFGQNFKKFQNSINI